MVPAAAQGVLLTVAYAGGPFHGFVEQANARTVAGELRGARRECDPHASPLRCVSRTDTGVHARRQLVAFDTTRLIPPRGWVLGVNRHLPDEISIRRVAIVPVGFDPRGYAKQKWYRYSLLRDVRRDPFLDATTWRIGGRLDLELARTEAQALVGTHDFAAFRSAADERTSTVRTLTSLAIEPASHDPRLVFVDVWGTGFLHNMVRIIVGTLIDVARGKLPPGTMARGLSTLDRRTLGITAPPQGLCLRHVELEAAPEPYDIWPQAGAPDTEGAQPPSDRGQCPGLPPAPTTEDP
jgi:tRNA pseudouridine38-40 synthase